MRPKSSQQIGFAIFVGIFTVACNALNLSSYPLVDTPLGTVQGTILTSVKGRNIYSFRGIRYAKPPIKELRFKSPEPIERWDGIHDATEDGHRCLQMEFVRNNLMTGDEDCLFLNVYSSQLRPSVLQPVMVFIHGGGFAFGDGLSDLYGPQRLLDKDIVLITFNYRLSALGFLSTEDSFSPGNYGLLDQVQLLKWVRDNVAAFGGDPNSVTIFGESAGGASTIYHLLSPVSKGLFHAAIAQSGTVANPWAFRPKSEPLRQAKLLAESIKCPTHNSEAIVRCLRRKAALDIAIKSYMFESEYSTGNKKKLEFLPVVDQGFRDVEFISKHPLELLEGGHINKVPVMIGICKDEGFIILQFLAIPGRGLDNFQWNDVKTSLHSRMLNYYNENETELDELISFYRTGIDDNNHSERIKAMTKLLSDSYFNQGIDHTINQFVTNNVTTYAYKLTHQAQHTISERHLVQDSEIKYLKELNVVTHLDDLRYLFPKSDYLKGDLGEQDVKMGDIILGLWTNFAKNGVPSLDGSPLNWIPVQPNQHQYLNLNLEPAIETGVFSSKPEVSNNNNGKLIKEEL